MYSYTLVLASVVVQKLSTALWTFICLVSGLSVGVVSSISNKYPCKDYGDIVSNNIFYDDNNDDAAAAVAAAAAADNNNNNNNNNNNT